MDDHFHNPTDKGYFETVENGPHGNLTDATRDAAASRMDMLIGVVGAILKPIASTEGTTSFADMAKYLPGEVCGALEFLYQGVDAIKEQMCPEHAAQAFVQAADVLIAYHKTTKVLQ